MITLFRAAGYCAAAIVLTAASFADPTMAWVGESAPVTSHYTDHAVATIDAPALPAPAPVTLEAIAAPEAPAVAAEAKPAARSLTEMVGDLRGSETEDAEHDCLATAVFQCADARGSEGSRPPRTNENWPGCLTTPHSDLGKRPDAARFITTSATASWPWSGSPFDSK